MRGEALQIRSFIAIEIADWLKILWQIFRKNFRHQGSKPLLYADVGPAGTKSNRGTAS